MKQPRLRQVIAAAAAALFALAVLEGSGVAGALSFVVRAAGVHGLLGRTAEIGTVSETERIVDIPTSTGAMRARVYAPASKSRGTVLLVSGLHPAGIDERRLIAFSRELARSSVTVVTPDIAGLSGLTITPAITADFEHAAEWLATRSGLAENGRIGLIGISFSGGLAVVVAGKPPLRQHVAYVLAIGGHDDLPRVLRYLCTGIDAPPTTAPSAAGAAHGVTHGAPPNEYGVAIVLFNVADRLVPAAQVERLRQAVKKFVLASSLVQFDKPAAERADSAIEADAAEMPEPARGLVRTMLAGDVAALGARLLPYVGEYGNAPDLSPSRSPKPAAPVYLLHGSDDNVIPSEESLLLAGDLREHTHVRLLVTDLLSHVTLDRPARVADLVRLIAFWRDLFRQR